MLGSIHVLPGADLSTGAIVLTVFLVGAMLALLVAFGVVAFRRAGESGLSGNLWRGGLVLVGVVLAWIVLDRSSIRDQMAERRSIETRSAELTVRAMAPGSALACLDAVAGATIETACEKALFASPEAVAAAVAYVDARLSLLASSIAVGQRDPAMRPAVERMRRAIEGDRFGLVAHVLMTRGCTSTDCPDLKLVRDTSRIMSNMRSRAFDAYVNVHAVAWHPGGVTVNTLAAAASTPATPPHAPVGVPQSPPVMAQPPAMPPSVSTTQPPPFIPQQQPVAAAPAMPDQPMVSNGSAPAQKYDYPSSASIPAVSIMTAEPAGPPAAEAKPAPAPRRPAQHQQQQRASSSREAAPRQAAPQASPQPAQQTAPPQTSGAR
ncbi:MAG: hypothetical protein K2Y27_24490 [Xanthobacteraceae bacterium]|nr:hypothetical protein [Xanthobacteraceae bacterium]